MALRFPTAAPVIGRLRERGARTVSARPPQLVGRPVLPTRTGPVPVRQPGGYPIPRDPVTTGRGGGVDWSGGDGAYGIRNGVGFGQGGHGQYGPPRGATGPLQGGNPPIGIGVGGIGAHPILGVGPGALHPFQPQNQAQAEAHFNQLAQLLRGASLQTPHPVDQALGQNHGLHPAQLQLLRDQYDNALLGAAAQQGGLG